ncbi:MAG: hypothetical protein PVG92_01085 [Holophagae bacterium]|jgi:hypothetical protein
MAGPTRSVRLFCWKPDREALLRPILEKAGFGIDAAPLRPSALSRLGQKGVDAVVIDLGRLPSQGRDVGISIRTRASTRTLPLVFVAGAADKVEATRSILPDAEYCSTSDLPASLEKVINKPPTKPVVPASNLAGYSGTPLPEKLGIRGGAKVLLVEAPNDFEATLGELPEEATVYRGEIPEADVTLWFVRSRADFDRGLEHRAAAIDADRLWVCWPKKASGIESDINQNHIRARGLETGLVDFKICAVDATWSGLCFTRRKR